MQTTLSTRSIKLECFGQFAIYGLLEILLLLLSSLVIACPTKRQWDEHIKLEFTDVTQTWYDDDVGALGLFKNAKLSFNLLKQFGPGHGYYLKPSKIIMIAYPDNIEARKIFGLNRRIHLGEFIGDDESKHDWKKVLTKIWERNICNINKTVGKYTQEKNAAVVREIQQE